MSNPTLNWGPCSDCAGTGWVVEVYHGEAVREGCSSCEPDYLLETETIEEARERMSPAELEADRRFDPFAEG